MSPRLSVLPILVSLLAIAFPNALKALMPAEMEQALATFRTEGPTGWSYTQTTQSGDERLVEDFDPLRPEGSKWKLIEGKGHAPTAEEASEYQRGKIQRSSALNAPRLEKQLDPASCELIEDTPTRLGCRFRLLPGPEAEEAAKHLLVSVFVDRTTRNVARIEIRSAEAFSPVFGVRIRESVTILDYAPSRPGEPPLLTRAHLKVRGRAFWLHSLDEEMDIAWSGHLWRGATRKGRE